MGINAVNATFYNHFHQDKPTGIGKRLVRRVSENIFDFAKIEQGNSVLEIGPGRGTFSDICLDKGIDYTAIEANEEMAQALIKRGVKVVKHLVPPFPELGRNFDVVVIINVLEHMDSMSKALELSEGVKKILNPGGKFVISVPDYLNWKSHFYVSDFSHNYITTWRRVEGLLISAGFGEIRGRFQSSIFTGLPCYLISATASLLPFGWLDVNFPNNRLFHKLYKLQLTFLRKVIIIGKKPKEEKKTF